MGIYQDEIDNDIQHAIDKKEVELAAINEKLTFLEGLAADVTVDQFHTAALASGSAEVRSMGFDGDTSDITDEELRAEIALVISECKTRKGTHATYTAFKDTTVKGDASSMKWITTSLQDEISALNSKKSSWAAKELDPTDTTAYDVIAQPVD